MKIGIVLYPTFGGSGIVATELGKALAVKGHEIHFITYSQPVKLGELRKNVFYHEVVESHNERRTSNSQNEAKYFVAQNEKNTVRRYPELNMID